MGAVTADIVVELAVFDSGADMARSNALCAGLHADNTTQHSRAKVIWGFMNKLVTHVGYKWFNIHIPACGFKRRVEQYVKQYIKQQFKRMTAPHIK